MRDMVRRDMVRRGIVMRDMVMREVDEFNTPGQQVLGDEQASEGARTWGGRGRTW